MECWIIIYRIHRVRSLALFLGVYFLGLFLGFISWGYLSPSIVDYNECTGNETRLLWGITISAPRCQPIWSMLDALELSAGVSVCSLRINGMFL